MAQRHPAFQLQFGHCTIRGIPLGGVSCTAFAMAMLIDAATDGAQSPTGCRVRRLVRPRDTVEGLTLRQVAEVAEETFGVRIAQRTGSRAVPVDIAIVRLRNGRGFVLQGNNVVFDGKGEANHAVYVHRGFWDNPGRTGDPVTALVFDPIRGGGEKWAWHKVLAFGAHLRFDKVGNDTLGMRSPHRLYAGFAPRPVHPPKDGDEPVLTLASGVTIRFKAKELDPGPRRFRAMPPPGKRIIIRSNPARSSGKTSSATSGAAIGSSPGNVSERGPCLLGPSAASGSATGTGPSGCTGAAWSSSREATDGRRRAGRGGRYDRGGSGR